MAKNKPTINEIVASTNASLHQLFCNGIAACSNGPP